MKCIRKILTIILLLQFIWLRWAGAVSDSFNINLQVEAEEEAPEEVPEEEWGGGGGVVQDASSPLIQNIKVSNITLHSATISWRTSEPTLCTVFLGETESYEKETRGPSRQLSMKYSLDFSGLSTGTIYNFKITCIDRASNRRSSGNRTFRTLSVLPAGPDITPPANVSDFQAVAGNQKVTLFWKNPPDADFKEVVIVRSADFYPASPWEGQVVYMGSQESFEDINLENDITYYYTAFSYDRAGNHSSGAVAAATPTAVPPAVPPVVPPVKPPVAPPPPEVEKLRLEDFDFLQSGQKLSLLDGLKIKLRAEEPLTASIGYGKVPEVLKTIMVTLEKDNKFFSFLLRIDEKKERYSAVLAPPSPGVYPMSLYVLDYKNQALKVIKAQLIVEAVGKPGALENDIWFVLILLCLLALLLYLLRREKRKKLTRQYRAANNWVSNTSYKTP